MKRLFMTGLFFLAAIAGFCEFKFAMGIYGVYSLSMYNQAAYVDADNYMSISNNDHNIGAAFSLTSRMRGLCWILQRLLPEAVKR
ncbi:MAG: hypothetical protein JW904_11890 [Spirochaetales bacterium]|nr:hypothetical protein [Spirochaetales bacterium]